jgi:hypothetical protein
VALRKEWPVASGAATETHFQVSGCEFQVFGCWMFDVGCWMFSISGFRSQILDGIKISFPAVDKYSALA